MQKVLTLINQLIEEHRLILERVSSIEHVANDAQAMIALSAGQDAFMPGRLAQQEGLKKLEELLHKTEKGLEAHFDREETTLLTVFKQYGDKEMVSAFNSVLMEHKDLRQRFTHSISHVHELMGGKLSRHIWESTAHDMRAHMSHTRKLLEAHAGVEQELFHKLRSKLTGQEVIS